MSTLNLVMIVRNEERCLKRCLDSVCGLVDGMVVVDTGSSDRTCEIAQSYGKARLFRYDWTQDFSAARNFSLSLSDSDWNLVLDADEYLENGSREGLEPFLANPGQIGAIERRDAYLDADGVNYAITYTSRLLPRGVGYVGRIHEQVDSPLPRMAVPLIFGHDGYLTPGKGERNLEILLDIIEDDKEDDYYLFQTAVTLHKLKRYEEAEGYFERLCRMPSDGINYQVKGRVSALYNMLELGLYERGLELIERDSGWLAPYADWQFACGVFYMKLVLSNPQKYIRYLPLIEKSYQNCLAIGEVPLHEGVLGNGSFRAAYNLGTWYEVSGNLQKAVYFYERSAMEGYQPAKERLQAIHGKQA